MANCKKIKVVHLIDSLGLGGAQTVVVNLAKYADRERFDLEVWSLHGPGPYAERLQELGIRVRALCRTKTDPRLPWRLIRAVRRARPDVLHTHLVVSCFLAEYLRWAMPQRTKLVCHVHNILSHHEEDQYQNRLERCLYRRGDVIVTCGKQVARSLNDLKINRRRLIAIRNGIDDDLMTDRLPQIRNRQRTAAFLDNKQPLLVSASRLMNQKNLEYALVILQSLIRHHPKVRYWIAGSGPKEQELKNQSSRLRLTTVVDFLGFRDDVPDLYQAADLLLMPSLHEGLSLTMVEAMGTGLIPIATPFEGVEEVITDDVNGLIIPFNDAVESARKISALLNDPARCERLRRAAFHTARTRFSASRMTRRVEALYQKLVEK